jgi:hypothetical protein
MVIIAREWCYWPSGAQGSCSDQGYVQHRGTRPYPRALIQRFVQYLAREMKTEHSFANSQECMSGRASSLHFSHSDSVDLAVSGPRRRCTRNADLAVEERVSDEVLERSVAKRTALRLSLIAGMHQRYSYDMCKPMVSDSPFTSLCFGLIQRAR